MALITRGSYASGDVSQLQTAPQISGDLFAGEDLDPVAPCYIRASDGLVFMSNGTAANEAAKFDGFTNRAVKSGQPVTLYGLGSRFRYGSGLTVGADLFVGATAGRLDNGATTGGVRAIARVLYGGTDIRVTKNSDQA